MCVRLCFCVFFEHLFLMCPVCSDAFADVFFHKTFPFRTIRLRWEIDQSILSPHSQGAGGAG